MSKLAQLRASRKSFTDLAKEVEDQNKKGFEKDARYWELAVDKAGNGGAIIRFLPAPPPETKPWVSYFSHGFQGPTGKWYIENSLTTFNEADPVSEANSLLWATGTKENKDLASARKRKLSYVSNILVVRDVANPENNGKVFLFRYGKKIFDMIADSISPQIVFGTEQPVDPFDIELGANFFLTAHKADGQRSYSKSKFESPSPVSKDDAVLEQILDQCHSLLEVIDRKHFKSYDELKRKFEYVVSNRAAAIEKADEDTTPVASPRIKSESPKRIAEDTPDDDDDDDTESYFASLTEE